MTHKKLEVSQLFQGLKIFIKEQFKTIGTWVSISLKAHLGILCWTILGMLPISFIVGFFMAIFENITVDVIDLFKVILYQYPFRFFLMIIILLALFLGAFYVLYKSLKKVIGFMNVVFLNALAAAENKKLPKFSHKDERLSFILYLLLFSIGTFLGTILLIVPGVIFLIRYSLGSLIMLDEKCSPLQAFKKNWDLTKGSFWPIFIIEFPLFLINYIPYLNILFILLNIFIPIQVLVYAYLYAQLKEQKAS